MAGPIAPESTAERRAAARRAALVGRVIDGRYRVLRYIGEGGMGAVYEVERDAGRAAIKVIAREGQELDARVLRRFEREAALAAEIDHPNVTRTFELGHDSDLGAPYLLMELLSGQDLGALLDERAPLVPEACVRIALQAARGLGAAHARGVIHRDVKPQNLFLHRVGEIVTVKVCDFGVAKLSEPEREGDVSSLTHSGGIVGSPRYMSPEQAQGAKDVDARSDIWSLCASLFEALSGRRLWEGTDTLGEIIVAICTRPVPRLAQVAPWVSAELAAVVHRGLNRDRSARFRDMQALLRALEPLADEREPLRWAALTRVAEAERRRVVAVAATTRTRADSTHAPASIAIDKRSVPRWRIAAAAGIVLAGAVALGMRQSAEGPAEGAALATASSAPPPAGPSVVRLATNEDRHLDATAQAPASGSSSSSAESVPALQASTSARRTSPALAVAVSGSAGGSAKAATPPPTTTQPTKGPAPTALPTREDWQ